MSKHYSCNCILIASLLFTVVSSCKLYPPTLKSLDKINFQRSGTTGFTAGTNAVIHNPNRVRVKIKDMDLVALINSKPIATVGKTNPILIKRNADFTIPLTIETASIESLFPDFKSLLGILSKEVELEVNGNVKIRAFLFIKRSFPIQYKQRIALHR